MKTIKFLQKKGFCHAGYVGSYPDKEADLLIKNGFAEEVKSDVKKDKKDVLSVKLKGDK
jgi:hypothetical protein